MRAVDVGIRHDDHAVIAQLGDVELVADPGTDGGDDRLDLGVGEHLVDPVLLRVDDLAAERQDRLEPAVAGVLCRAAGGSALDEIDLRFGRVARLAVGQLPGEGRVVERPFAASQVARLPCRLARVPRGDSLQDDLARVSRVLLEELSELRVDGLFDQPTHPGIAELRLRLTLELGVAQLDRDDGCKPLAHVLSLEVLLLFLQEAFVAGVLVQRACEGTLEPREVRAALVRVDVVGEREDRLDVRRVPLHRDLDRTFLGLVLEVDDALVDRLLGLVDVGDEVTDPAVVLELVAFALGALVDEDDLETAGQECRLAQALSECLGREIELLEDIRVGHEADRGAGLALLRLPGDGHVRRRLAAGELLPVDLPVPPHLGHEPLGERVHDRDADAVQAAGDLVALPAELPAGVELRQDDCESRQPLVGHEVDRDTGPPILDGDRIVGVEAYLDAVVPARESLIDRVVDDFVDQVVKTSRPCRADVHAGALTNGLQALENSDVFSAVTGFSQ